MRKEVPWWPAVLVWVCVPVLGCTAFASAGERSVSAAEEMTAAALRAAMEDPDEGERRSELLREVTKAHPDFPLARWHLGQVQIEGRWMSIERAERSLKQDEARLQFTQLRDAALEDPSRWMSIARWTQRHRLDEETRWVWSQVLERPESSDRDRAMAAGKLGLAHVDGRWLTAKDRAARDAGQQALQQADRTWRKKLIHWRSVIEGRSPALRRQAIGRIQEIRDPTVIPLLEELFSTHSMEVSDVAVEVLADWPHAEASRSLVLHALYLHWPEVRERAIEALKTRPLHDYVPMVIGSLVAPLQSQFLIGASPDGEVRYRHQFYRSGQQMNRQMVVDRSWSPAQQVATVRRDAMSPDAIAKANDETLKLWHQERSLRLVAAAVQARRTEEQAARDNEWLQANQRPVYQLLREVTGQKFPDEPGPWINWWQDYNDRTEPPAPTFTTYSNYVIVEPIVYLQPLPAHECFAAGTLVRTQFGLKPIETIQGGDRVLSQSIETGELTYKMVSASTLRPVTDHCRIVVGEESIVCTLGHPFWLDQQGWRMARHLSVGDRIQTATGPLRVDRIESADSQEAYNLVVEDFHSYFVGTKSILAHDNTERQPTRALVPGVLRDRMKIESVRR